MIVLEMSSILGELQGFILDCCGMCLQHVGHRKQLQKVLERLRLKDNFKVVVRKRVSIPTKGWCPEK